MIKVSTWLTLAVCLLLAHPGRAQAPAVWIQIEARPSLALARQSARDYAQRLPDVHGFALATGWYGIVLGPYRRAEAEQLLDRYRAQGAIPPDSYLQQTARLGEQFWPRDFGLWPTTEPTPALPRPAPDSGAAAGLVTDPDPSPDRVTEEPLSEARRSEALLTTDQRRGLQTALQALGYYTATIDGAFGPGTRDAMAAWQADNGYSVTGTLTQRQRATLLAEHAAPLTSVGMRRVVDDAAGIAVALPMGEVAFASHSPPFALYEPTGPLGAQVLLISQPGDRGTLAALFEAMQSLDIVPLDGPRRLEENRFTLEGRDGTRVVHAQAALQDGEIKGFALVWPAQDEPRRRRVLAEMTASFERRAGVLDPAAGTGAVTGEGLLAGLATRQPRLSRSGFFVTAAGVVATTRSAVAGCSRITIGGTWPATVVTEDRTLGIALLRPDTPVAPLRVAHLAETAPAAPADIAVAGFSYEGVLDEASLTRGRLAALTGLGGETHLYRLQLTALPGDAGGPVLAGDGRVLGLLLPRATGSTDLPEDVTFALAGPSLRAVLSQAGVAPGPSAPPGARDGIDLQSIGADMTVLVSCWD